jgi:hypothetical protein
MEITAISMSGPIFDILNNDISEVKVYSMIGDSISQKKFGHTQIS